MSVPDEARAPGVPGEIDSLVLDLLEWIGSGPRAYSEVMEAWRTSCPRLPVWEEANARGFIARSHEQGHPAMVALTQPGLDFLAAHRAR